jgi:hypothetical protein
MTMNGIDPKGRLDKNPTRVRCPECGRVFDLLDEDDAGEWYYGYDCEGEA